jgi:hypothetical protein
MSKNGEENNNEVRLIGRRGEEISSHAGIYSTDAAILLANRYPNRYITIEELCRVQFNRVTQELVRICRNRLWRTINVMIFERRQLGFIIYEPDGYRRILGFKLANLPKDKVQFDIWLKRIIDRQEFTEDKLAMIELLIENGDSGSAAALALK